MKNSEAVIYLLCGLCVLLTDCGINAAEDNRQGNMFLCQDPRFIAARKGRTVSIICSFAAEHLNTSHCNTTWYLGMPNGSFISNVIPDKDPKISINGSKSCSVLLLKNIQKKHSGIYFCKINTNSGERISHCGTEVMVLGYGSLENAKSRNMMKDAIIIIQTILIALFIVIPAMLIIEMKKKRSVKMEDHTYEGLEIYQSATYEDIQNVRVLSSKSMIGEHPCME
ncbi:B-cell antigen receptor complex-associated beta chain [Pelobates cultripes]|uniref:B-cell antigen receptor complex-associated beta chain n=1 Tax=Pelobates cultripes TaxID=61616 RepID=A0AAD1WG31_PELCU|nr:B-cell antigen receptor complex-associated beta chain [Pelobates cultripes]